MDGFDRIEEFEAVMEQAEEAMASSNLDEAERCYREAARLAETLEDEPVSEIESLMGVASVMTLRGEAAGALDLFQRVLEIALPNYGPADELTVEIVIQLMELRRSQGREDLAAACLETLVQTALDSGEFDGPWDALNQLGVHFQLQDRLTVAEQLFQRAIEAWPVSGGDEADSDYAVMLANLGEVLHDLGDDARAEPLLKRALAIYERDEETDPASQSAAMTVYADLLECGGRESEAAELRDQAAQIAPPADTNDLIYQMTVTYDSMPALDIERLAADINALDPSAEPCRIVSSLAPEKSAEGLEILSSVLSVDGIPNFILLHNVATPDGPTRSLIEMAVVEGLRERLENHQAFALVTGVDPDSAFDPMDRMIAMLKIAIALGYQGGSGILNTETGMIFPAEFLAGAVKPEMWETLREDGGPADLVIGFLPLYTDEDELWFVSCGHGFFDLPDLAILLEEGQNAEETFLVMRTLFQEVFYYMYQNGGTIEPGHTMEVGGRFLRFSAPTPEQEEFLTAPCGRLIITEE